MGSRNLAEMAQETIRISKQGYYKIGDKKILLTGGNQAYSFEDVIVLDEQRLNSIVADEDAFFERNFCSTSGTNIFLVDGDSYQIAYEFENPLVMNFANAIHPGGGFLHGAKAQEESLCRNSTLYQSISSKTAKVMYDYNRENMNPIDSDYMLITPNVCVFRDLNGNLLNEPYNVSVITIPAPNKNGRAGMVKQEVLDSVMKDRIRKMLYAAARYGYQNLVLGAWGCGAFGHNTEMVAGYFHEILIKEHMNRYFENIAFAILHDESKIEAFAKVFGSEIEDLTQLDEEDEDNDYLTGDYRQANYSFPCCNHTSEISSNNIGYAQGVLEDGVPFEAELWKHGDSTSISVVIPVLHNKTQTEENLLKNGNIVGYHDKVESFHEGILIIGMVMQYDESDYNVTIHYVDYLEESGLIEFTGSMRNGYVSYVTDIEGKDFAYITITLNEDGNNYAVTPLRFLDFPGYKRKIRVIK